MLEAEKYREKKINGLEDFEIPGFISNKANHNIFIISFLILSFLAPIIVNEIDTSNFKEHFINALIEKGSKIMVAVLGK